MAHREEICRKKVVSKMKVNALLQSMRQVKLVNHKNMVTTMDFEREREKSCIAKFIFDGTLM